MNRQDGHPSFASAAPSSDEDEVGRAITATDKLGIDDAVDDAEDDDWAIGDVDGDHDNAEDGPTLTLVDGDDGPAMENAFVGDVADDAAEADADDDADEPIEFDEGGAYPRLVTDGPSDDGDEPEASATDPAAETSAHDPSDDEAASDVGLRIGRSTGRLAADLPAGGTAVPRGGAATSQAIDGSVALDDLRATPADDVATGDESASADVSATEPAMAMTFEPRDADVADSDTDAAEAVAPNDVSVSPIAIDMAATLAEIEDQPAELTDDRGIQDQSTRLGRAEAEQAAADVDEDNLAGDGTESLSTSMTVRLDDLRSAEADLPIAQAQIDDDDDDEEAADTIVPDVAEDADPDRVAEDSSMAVPKAGADVLATADDVEDTAEGLPAESSLPDDAPASYQSHFLEDGDDEPEFVAHVDVPGRDAVEPPASVRLAGKGPAAEVVAEAAMTEDPSGGPAEAAPVKDALPGQIAQDDSSSLDAAASAPAAETFAEVADEAAAAEAFDGSETTEAADSLEATESIEAADVADVTDAAGSAIEDPPRRRGVSKGKSPRQRDRGVAGIGGPSAVDEQAVAADDDAPADYADVDDLDAADGNDPTDAAADSEVDGRLADDEADGGTDSPVAKAYNDLEYEADGELDEDEELLAVGATGGGWTIPLLCLGIAVIACCLIIPQADANRRLAYERQVLRRDLESVQAQVATNDEFLRKLAGDPSLAERLASRQMKLMRPNTKLLPVGQGDAGTSPFDLVQVTPPAPMDPYEPIGGRIAVMCYAPRTKLYLTGGGLFLAAAGLVLGAGGRQGEAGAGE